MMSLYAFKISEWRCGSRQLDSEVKSSKKTWWVWWAGGMNRGALAIAYEVW